MASCIVDVDVDLLIGFPEVRIVKVKRSFYASVVYKALPLNHFRQSLEYLGSSLCPRRNSRYCCPSLWQHS